MKILAIETSCDDTGVAVIEASKNGHFFVLSDIIASQIEVHKQYGGVYPFAAKREHIKNLPPVYEEALKEAKIEQGGINLIAVTNGPGLEPCLWVGVNFAKDLAQKLNKPLVPVNHIESHILVNYLENKNIKFPAVALVVSGGHTQLILMRKIRDYKILGETRDDAAGECFDKCAKILGLGYPGGPEIARLASQVVIPGLTRNPESVHKTLDSRLRGNDTVALPRPMIHTKDYDFSFSGLKTAVLYAWKKCPKIDDRQKMDKLKIEFAAEIQQAIIDVLIKKTMKAVEEFSAKTLILGGGVSANSELRSQFKFEIRNSKFEINFLVPPENLSTDNAVMTAIAGYFNRNKKVAPSKVAIIKADANLRIGK